MGKQIYPAQKHFVITWPYTDRTNDRPPAPQGNQCLLSHLVTQEKKAQSFFIIPQDESSKITVFVCDKKYDPKIWKCSRRRRRANMTDLEVQNHFIQVSLPKNTFRNFRCRRHRFGSRFLNYPFALNVTTDTKCQLVNVFQKQYFVSLAWPAAIFAWIFKRFFLAYFKNLGQIRL